MRSLNLILWALPLLGFASLGHSIPNSYITSREVQFSPSPADPQVLGKRRISTLPNGYPKLEMKQAMNNGQTYFGTIEEKLFIKANDEGKAAAGAAPKAGSSAEASASTNAHIAININPMDWEDLDRYAADGYDHVGNGINNNFNGIVVVTAQYTPGIGLSVWSKPRGEKDVEYLLGEKFGLLVYPHYVKFINERQLIDDDDQLIDPPSGGVPKVNLVHAEDAAAIGSAREVAKKEQGGNVKHQMRRFKFVANTRAVTYGKFSKTDTEGVKPPCGSPNTQPKFTRPCAVTSHEHGIAYTSYRGALGHRPANLGGTGAQAQASTAEQGTGAPHPGGLNPSGSATSSWESAANAALDGMDTT